MVEVLVLAEHTPEGGVKRVTLELLTAARRLGEYGAQRIYAADSPDFTGYVVAPTAELLAQLVAGKAPAAVLVAATAEGKEIAGRLAVKTDSGVLTDAVDVTAGMTARRWPRR